MNRKILICLSLMTLPVLLSTAAYGQTFSVIYTFTSQETHPYAGVTLRNGDLYSVTLEGGVYEITPSGSIWNLMFISDLSYGYEPLSRVVFGPDGNLYGTTAYNSLPQQGGGLLYNVISPNPCNQANCSLSATAPRLWQNNLLYSFRGAWTPFPDGAYPYVGDLIWDRQGNLYGTTARGGQYDKGTVYQLTCSHGTCTEEVIYNFAGLDGWFPASGVIFDSAGNLYGTTVFGGQYNRGAVFELEYHNGSWAETVLYSFTGDSDGAYPSAGVILIKLAIYTVLVAAMPAQTREPSLS